MVKKYRKLMAKYYYNNKKKKTKKISKKKVKRKKLQTLHTKAYWNNAETLYYTSYWVKGKKAKSWGT